MAFGSTINPGMNHEGASVVQVSSGSVKSDWAYANTSLQTVNTDALLNIGTSTDYATVRPVTVPEGATRVHIRASVGTDATTFTTNPVVRVVGADANGVPQRLDSETDDSAAGVTLTFTSSSANFTADDAAGDAKYWSDGVAAIDCLGHTTVYVLVETAAAITDGASPVTAQAAVRFTN
jgi:hypothetical protein